MYADDVKLYQQYNEPAQSLDLQSDLHAFRTWFNDNKLILIGSKCKGMTFFRVDPF